MIEITRSRAEVLFMLEVGELEGVWGSSRISVARDDLLMPLFEEEAFSSLEDLTLFSELC